MLFFCVYGIGELGIGIRRRKGCGCVWGVGRRESEGEVIVWYHTYINTYSGFLDLQGGARWGDKDGGCEGVDLSSDTL